jgi:hypothetical protein
MGTNSKEKCWALVGLTGEEEALEGTKAPMTEGADSGRLRCSEFAHAAQN